MLICLNTFPRFYGDSQYLGLGGRTNAQTGAQLVLNPGRNRQKSITACMQKGKSVNVLWVSRLSRIHKIVVNIKLLERSSLIHGLFKDNPSVAPQL